MGKKKIIEAKKDEVAGGQKPASSAGKSAKVKVSNGTLYIRSTYNNTVMTLTDKNGNALFASSSGALGFKGAKKARRSPRPKLPSFWRTRLKTPALKKLTWW